MTNSDIPDRNVGDMISRQAAIYAVHKDYDTILDFKSDGRTMAGSFEDIINALPSAQSERESAEWIKNNNGTYSCNKCQSWILKEQRRYARYCLHCGSKMERRTNEGYDLQAGSN